MDNFDIVVWIIAAALIQACVSLALPGLYAKITKTWGIISIEPFFTFGLVIGSLVAIGMAIANKNIAFLAAPLLGIILLAVIFRLIAHKPQK